MNAPGTVLLVGHDESLAKNVYLELESRGHVVLMADESAPMHDLAITTHPDLVVIDSDIPNAGSQRILIDMQRDDRTAEVPVLMLGSHEGGSGWGTMVDTVEKPIVPDVLASRVEVGLEMHRLRQELRAIRQDNDVGGHIDELTGLNGGRRLRDELAHHAATVKRYGGHVSIVMFDLDRFESTNEYFGKEAGDTVLCEIGQRLLSDVRTSDIVGRWRGDQFMAILPCTNVMGASFFAERFRQMLSEVPVRLVGGASVGVSASFGCSEGTDEVEMVQAAEAAIGTAKRRGRNGVVAAPVLIS
jgi:two-component system cell cycle response regulator